ncbi:MAG: DUF5667 domain-containing protein [Patescibacteria group bacterium]
MSALRSDVELGALTDKEAEEMRRRLFSRLEAETPRKVSGFTAVFAAPKAITDMFARPLAVASLVVVLVLGGWITSVNASLQTVPGDMLYSVKLVSEKAQLSLATDGARRKLRAEFASRRLNEVAALVRRNDIQDKDEKVKTAVAGFNKQIAGIKDGILEETDEAQVMETTRVVEQKKQELDIVLEQSEVAKDTESSETIQEAVNATSAAKNEAVDALVIKAKDSGSELSAQELSRQFANDLRSIMARSSVLLVRIDRLERALAFSNRPDILFNAPRERFEVKSQNEALNDAMDLAAQGGYRSAFDSIRAVDAVLKSVNEKVIVAEIAFTEETNQGIKESTNAEEKERSEN